jgi:hypothetical protein
MLFQSLGLSLSFGIEAEPLVLHLNEEAFAQLYVHIKSLRYF